MNILFMDWLCFGRDDLLDAFKQLGHEVFFHSLKGHELTLQFELDFTEDIKKTIKGSMIDLAFSMNYYPSVSEACKETGTPYLSWVYDNPFIQLYGINIINDCNHIYTFNSYTYKHLKKQHVTTVSYAPLATNTERLNRFYLSRNDRMTLGSDVSFVGSFYNEKDNYYDDLAKRLKEKDMYKVLGYVDALIDTQYKIYGINFVPGCMNKTLIENIIEVYPYYKTYFTYFADDPYIYAWVIGKKVTELERLKMLESLSNHFQVKVFTQDENAVVGNCEINGVVHYHHRAPKVYKGSKINLNITLRTIETGIPFRAIEIMGCAGFVLTNYQEDFLLHFEPDKDFVFYESEEDLIEKCRFYLNHDTERKKIAKHAYERVASDHTYIKRIPEMLNAIFPGHK